MAQVNSKFRTDEHGVLTPLNSDAEESLHNMQRSREEVLRDCNVKESVALNATGQLQGWVKVDTSEHQRAVDRASAYMRLGMSPAEAKEAAGL